MWNSAVSGASSGPAPRFGAMSMDRMLSPERHRTEPREGRLRLQTAVRLRWFGVLGQLLTVGFVYLVLGFGLPLGVCLAFIALSAWLNVFLRLRYPARTRLSTALAT